MAVLISAEAGHKLHHLLSKEPATASRIDMAIRELQQSTRRFEWLPDGEHCILDPDYCGLRLEVKDNFVTDVGLFNKSTATRIIIGGYNGKP